jgi:hypothetical protein
MPAKPRKKKGEAEKARLRPDQAWLDRLKEAWDQAVEVGRKRKVSLVRLSGVGRTTLLRVREAKDSSVSFAAVESMRLAVNEVLGEEIIPPPYVLVRDAREYAWALLGRRLADRGGLEDLVDELTKHLDAKDRENSARKISDASRSRITEILISDEAPDDREPRH